MLSRSTWDSFWKDIQMVRIYGVQSMKKIVFTLVTTATTITTILTTQLLMVTQQNGYHDPVNEFSNMWLEERVLYRLLSGLHSSTTISISKHYYPPSKKKSVWYGNPIQLILYKNSTIIRNIYVIYIYFHINATSIE
jgi:hypothetical protein